MVAVTPEALQSPAGLSTAVRSAPIYSLLQAAEEAGAAPEPGGLGL